MSALKSIFRRKSKKGLRSETPTNEPPSPSRVPQSDSWNNSSKSQASPTGTYPPRNNGANRNSLPARQAPQDPSTLVDEESLPYENLPTGTQPQRGTVPIHGNPVALPDDTASRGATGQKRLSTTLNPQRRSVPPPGTAVSTNQDSHGQRPTSRSSGYTDPSRYSEDAGRQTISQDIPPVPQSTIRGVGGDKANGNQVPRQDRGHERIISSASTASNKRTPIADEFTSTQWYNHHGTPPIPSFQEDRSTHDTPSHAAGDAFSSSSRVEGLDKSTVSRNTFQGNGDGLHSKKLSVGPPADGNQFMNGDQTMASKPRKSSIPRRSLEKPLPVPTELQQPISDTTALDRSEQSQSIPVRETTRNDGHSRHNKESHKASRGVVEDGSRSKVQPTEADLERLRVLEGTPNVQSGAFKGHQTRSSGQAAIRSGQQQLYNRPLVVEGANSPPSLEGIVDLRNSTDTSTHVHYAPAILHETVLPHVHEVREEQITRDIVNHQIHHRILPVIDVQILPAVHFARASEAPDAEFYEVPAVELPGRPSHHWVIAETVSKLPRGQAADIGPRGFTARTFAGTTGDRREYVSADGVPTTEETWVHPPRIAQEPIRRGITYPVDLE